MSASGTISPINWLLFIQGMFYVVTGLWPIFSMRTFEKITGPKTDKWLVKALGLLLSVDGLIFLISASTQPSASTIMLSVGTAVVLLGVDLRYTLQKVISKIYLLDAITEAVFASTWVWIFTRH